MKTLRDEITTEMQRKGAVLSGKNDFRRHGYCTWWFRLRIERTTEACRAELKRMEREGLVVANREQANNTQWMLVSPVQSSVER